MSADILEEQGAALVFGVHSGDHLDQDDTAPVVGMPLEKPLDGKQLEIDGTEDVQIVHAEENDIATESVAETRKIFLDRCGLGGGAVV